MCSSLGSEKALKLGEARWKQRSTSLCGTPREMAVGGRLVCQLRQESRGHPDESTGSHTGRRRLKGREKSD